MWRGGQGESKEAVRRRERASEQASNGVRGGGLRDVGAKLRWGREEQDWGEGGKRGQRWRRERVKTDKGRTDKGTRGTKGQRDRARRSGSERASEEGKGRVLA